MALRNTRQGDAATPPTARQLAEQHRRTAEVLLASGAKAAGSKRRHVSLCLAPVMA